MTRLLALGFLIVLESAAAAQPCSQQWTDVAYYGSAAILFADINGDGIADAVALNHWATGPGQSDQTITVRYAATVGQPGFGSTTQVLSSNEVFYAEFTYIVDVNGDGFADIVRLPYFPSTPIRVQLNSGLQPVTMAPPVAWTTGGFTGDVGTFMADVTGDGKADLIAVSTTGTTVRRSTGTSFSGVENWSFRTASFFGERATLFADVTGDGLADAIAVNNNGVWIRRSTGIRFQYPPELWTSGPFFGDHNTFVADVTGDGKADMIAVNSSGILVTRSNGNGFGPNENWLAEAAPFGTIATAFAPVSNATRADLILVNTDDPIIGRPNLGSSFAARCPPDV